MRRFIIAALVALTLCSGAVRAAITVQPESVVVLGGLDQIVTFDVFATNPDAGENERLNAFTIMLTAPNFGGPDAPRFVIPPADPVTKLVTFAEPTVHPYVFGAYPGNPPVDPAGLSDEKTILISAALGGTGQEANVSDSLNGFAKISVFVPANARLCPRDIIQVDPGIFALQGAGSQIVAVPGFSTFGGLCPEPSSLTLLAPLAAMALGRRRAGVLRTACGRVPHL